MANITEKNAQRNGCMHCPPFLEAMALPGFRSHYSEDTGKNSFSYLCPMACIPNIGRLKKSEVIFNLPGSCCL